MHPRAIMMWVHITIAMCSTIRKKYTYTGIYYSTSVNSHIPVDIGWVKLDKEDKGAFPDNILSSLCNKYSGGRSCVYDTL